MKGFSLVGAGEVARQPQLLTSLLRPCTQSALIRPESLRLRSHPLCCGSNPLCLYYTPGTHTSTHFTPHFTPQNHSSFLLRLLRRRLPAPNPRLGRLFAAAAAAAAHRGGEALGPQCKRQLDLLGVVLQRQVADRDGLSLIS